MKNSNTSKASSNMNATSARSSRKTTSVKAAPAVASAKTATASTAVIVSPRGKQYPVSNIAAFARRFSLDAGNLGKVLRGQRANVKGWTRLNG